MLDSPALRDESTLINGIAVNYCVDAARAAGCSSEWPLRVRSRSTLRPNKAEVDRLAKLTQARAATVGKLKALRKLKAPADEIADLVAERNELGARIKLAEKAGLDPRRSRIRLVQAYDGGREVLVIEIDRTGVGVLAALDGASIICHNAAFEMSFLEPAGVAFREVHCTLHAARLTLGEKSTSLADVAAAYLNVTLDKSQQVSDWGAPHLTREQLTYAALDAIVEWEVAQHVFVALRDQTPAYEIQIRAVPAAMRMQERGFKFDVDAHARLIAELKQERLAVEQEYRAACLSDGGLALADKAPSTPAQKGDLLRALLTSEELRRWARTARSGALSTRRSELNRARHYPPILALAKLSRIDKMLSSFGQTLAVLTAPATGRIHANYSVASTASGRASCARPNLHRFRKTDGFAPYSSPSRAMR
jgi:ribonuclease D